MSQGAQNLSRRERQIMDITYRRGEVSVNDVLAELPDPPSYSAVRAMMRVLEDKGHLVHREDGPRYVYSPTTSPEDARRSALRRVLSTFFGDSTERAVAALIDLGSGELGEDELDRISSMIDAAKKEGR